MTTQSAEKITIEELVFPFPESKIRELKIPEESCIVGQNRAVSALKMGIGISEDGYNIFVMGAPGTGRRTVLSSLLDDYKPNEVKLQDIAYAYNFNRSSEPQVLYFPPGKAGKFNSVIKKAVENIHKRTIQLVKSESFIASRKKLIMSVEIEENEALSDFEVRMFQKDFKVEQIKDGEISHIDLVPLIKGKPVPFTALQSLMIKGKITENKFSRIREEYYRSLDELSDIFNLLHEKKVETDSALKRLHKDSVKPIIQSELKKAAALVESYKTENKKQEEDNKKILNFIKLVQSDLESKINLFSEPFKTARAKKNFMGRYAVNIIYENSTDKNYVVTENLPSFSNLFGTIETHSDSEDSFVNGHLRIRAGAVHNSLNGYLILRLQDLLVEEDSWVYLKRILQSGKIEIQMPPSANHGSVLKPEPISADFKLIIIGGEYSYDILYQEDPDFYKLFKVCAEFDSAMPRTDENTAALLSLVESLCKKRKTLPITDSGLAELVRFASYLSECRHLLSTQFTKIADLITEADYAARKENKNEIDGKTINTALEHRHYLHALQEEEFADMLKQGDILINVKGKEIGKVNGLAVEERGYHSFGVPVAVTAQASPGTGSIINIEREAGLSGEIYDKAHLIITSLLRKKYCEEIPLSLCASLCFEQSYSYIDGDSASCAEFLALVSAIGQIPMRQDIAVTGSLNQLGKVQPVGGISEKIEGFFDTCKILGFTGTQGVIIPHTNKNNLFLPEKILKAVEEGQFNIWTIKTIDEALNLLSQMEEREYASKISCRLNIFHEKIKETFPTQQCLNP